MSLKYLLSACMDELSIQCSLRALSSTSYLRKRIAFCIEKGRYFGVQFLLVQSDQMAIQPLLLGGVAATSSAACPLSSLLQLLVVLLLLLLPLQLCQQGWILCRHLCCADADTSARLPEQVVLLPCQATTKHKAAEPTLYT